MIQINPNRKIESNFPDSTPKTATDNFTTLDGGLVNALTVEMTPVQDLHGYSKPWAGGAGKNKLPITISDVKSWNTLGTWSDNVYTLNSTTFDCDVDASGYVNKVTVNGTPSAKAELIIFTGIHNFNGQILTGCPAGGSASTYQQFLQRNGSPWTVYATDSGNGVTIADTPDDISLRINISISKDYVASGLAFYPMTRLSSIADPTFEPYSNICPISGHTEAESDINGTTYTTSLGTTVYGGELDMVSGEGESNVGVLSETDFTTVRGQNARGLYYLDFDYVEKDNPQIISNMLETKSSDAGWASSTPCVAYSISGGNRFIRVYVAENTVSDFQTNYSGLQIAYPLATPTTLTLTGQNITAEVGENNVSAPLDGQEIQTDGVTYKEMFSWADVVAYVQSQVNP